MGDLQKFVRQHFFDNHWTKDVDPSTLTAERLQHIDSAFCHIDVKSKLCLLLSFCNWKCESSPEVNKHIENIFLQALDEENNLVKAVATILHSKQSLNYLNFDISPTNEAFKKNVEKLLRSASDWKVVETPLLSEFLGDNVLALVQSASVPKRSNATRKVSSSNLVSPRHPVSFQCRGKPQSLTLKESYLERLKDECQRRRVHVPIPGRSFARSEEVDDEHDLDRTVFLTNQSTKSLRSSVSSDARKSSSDSRNRFANRIQSSTWSQPTANMLERPAENRTPNLTERLMSRSPSLANGRKSGIKLLNFDELPAFGPKAKQLRKEQMEKERILKRNEREERFREQKAAREAAKLARQTERQALLESRRHPVPSTTWDDILPITMNESAIHSSRPSSNFNVTGMRLPGTTVIEAKGHAASFNHPFSPVSSMNASTACPTSYVTSHQPPGVNFINRHPLLSMPSSVDIVQRVADDDDDDDDDIDELMMPELNSGTYRLGIPSGFRPFNPNANVGPQHSYSVPKELDRMPSLVSSVQSAPHIPPVTVPTPSVGYTSGSSRTVAFNQDTSVLSTPSPYSANESASNVASSGMQLCFLAPRATTASSSCTGVVKIVSPSGSSPLVRILRPAQPLTNTTPTKPIPSVSGVVNSPRNPVAASSLQQSFSYALSVNDTMVPESHIMTVAPSMHLQQPTPVFARIVPAARSASIVPTAAAGPIRIAPRPAKLVQLTPTNHDVNLASSPLVSSQPHPLSIVQPSQSQPQHSQPQHLYESHSTTGSTNATWMLDGRQVILAPMVGMASTMAPASTAASISMSLKTNLQSPPTTNFVQILPRPLGTSTGSVSLPNYNDNTDTESNPSRPMSASTGQSVLITPEPMFLSSVSLATSQQNLFTTQATQPTIAMAPSLRTSTLVLPSSSDTLLSLPSGVKIQDDLCLTEAQLNSVRNLFQYANRVSRPEKAMIISFIAGARGNPNPEAGNTVRIRLSEYRERVLNQATGQLVDVAADTYLHMDYSTGAFEKVKYYRTEPPEVLLRLPVQPALL